MNTKKTRLRKVINDNTVSAEEAFRGFTPEQKKIADAEIRYYDVLVELKKLRKQMGLTQEELAVKAKLPRTTITKIESGGYNPTINTLMSIAAAMDKKLQLRFL